MRIYQAIRLASLFLGLIVGSSVVAQATHSVEQGGSSLLILQDALEAFNSKEYSLAKDLYLMLDETNPSYTSSYNLAVCYYRLGEWQEARKRFLQLHNHDYTDEHVHLNLAIAETKLGLYESALDHFYVLSTSASSDAIASIAYKNYRNIEESLLKVSAKSSVDSDRWLLNASIGRGYDDSVVSFVDQIAQDGDSYTELNASAFWYSTADYDNNWLIDTALYTARYSEASDYNVDVVSLGFKKHFGFKKAQRLELGARLDQSNVGGEAYLRSFYIHAADRFKLSKNTRLKILSRYHYSQALDARFKGLAGTGFRCYSRITHQIGEHRFSFRYQFDDETKDDLWSMYTIYDDDDLVEDELVDIFTSYSARRHGLYGNWSYRFHDWRVKLDANYRASHYKDAHIFYNENLPYSELRSDMKFAFGATFSREFGKHWLIDTEVRKTVNESNLSKYDYNQSIIALTLAWQN